ncbi:type VII secretion system-associated protein [Streptomyces sp. NPDC035033]|uniref:type VII secretion system-associated protein n=1 Tax=Streptomyces sp. NPDC035033 TaxID=3155368 RepID=UPI0033C4CCB5
MPITADLTKLDAAALQRFVDGPVTDFVNSILQARREHGGQISVGDIANGYTNTENVALRRPLAIGFMAGDDSVHGASLNTNTVSGAKNIDDILKGQQQSYQQLHDGLIKLIQDFLQKQHQQFDRISAEEFLDHITVATTDNPAHTGANTTRT